MGKGARDRRPARTILGNLVGELRRGASMTQEDVADAMGMSQEWVSQLERGVVKVPPVATLARLADVLGGNVEDFVIAAGMARNESGARRVVEAAVPPRRPAAEDRPADRSAKDELWEMVEGMTVEEAEEVLYDAKRTLRLLRRAGPQTLRETPPPAPGLPAQR
jgi:transcriptional regulator with XRE-family HTH domain